MNMFRYRVKDDMGRTLYGVMEAMNKKEVRKKFLDTQFYYMGCDTVSPQSVYGKKIKFDALLMFTHRLTSLLESGVSILQAMNILWRQSEDQTVQLVVSHIRQRLEGGSRITDALKDFPRIFSSMYIALLSVAEEGGGLVYVLRRVGKHLEYQRQMRTRFKRAALYPVLVVVFAILTLWLMFALVVPVFARVLQKVNVDLPYVTQLVLKISAFMRSPLFFVVMLGLVFAGFVGHKMLRKNQHVGYILDAFKVRVPVIGALIYSISLSRFLRSLSVLLGAGLPVLRCFDVAKTTLINSYLFRNVEEVQQRIEEGNSLYESFKAQRHFPIMMVELIGVGESTGSIVNMLEKLTDHLDEEVEYNINKVLTILEPALIIVVGCIVMFTLLSIYLPILELWKGLAQ